MEDVKKRSIGRVLRIVRYANNMTIAFASRVSSVSVPYLRELESEKKWNVSEEIMTKLCNAYGLKLFQIKELEAYYESLKVEENRKFRLTLMKTLEMIERNYVKATNSSDLC